MMAQRRRRKPQNPEAESADLPPPEQGDLMADAESAATAQEAVEGEPAGEHPESASEGEAQDPGALPEGEPPELEMTMEAEVGAEDDVEEDLLTIPDSAWEQKLAWAKEQARGGRLEEAADLYRELVEEDPVSVRARNNLGILLDEMGNHEEAVELFEGARTLDPENQEILCNLGAALGAMGRFPEAEEVLQQALRLGPADLLVRTNLGILFFRRGLYEEAQAALQAVCREDPDHGPAFFYRGEALNRLGRVEEAVEVLERAIVLIPTNPRAYYTLGILFDKLSQLDRASAMYRKARDLSNP
jgi:Flp pilus assembly protein TadD